MSISVGLIAGDMTTVTIELTDNCAADINGDGSVGFFDLTAVLSAWGACAQPCDADVNGDGEVDVQDLLIVLSAWGACSDAGGAQPPSEEELKQMFPEMDFDGDGVLNSADNCVLETNTSQADADADAHGDACDCAPGDGTAFDSPHEIGNVRLSATKNGIQWESDSPNSGSGTVYDVARGDLAQLPIGTGSSETCLADDTALLEASDPEKLQAGQGVWYLVRGANVCGVGRYGADSAGNDRMAGGCP